MREEGTALDMQSSPKQTFYRHKLLPGRTTLLGSLAEIYGQALWLRVRDAK